MKKGYESYSAMKKRIRKVASLRTGGCEKPGQKF
jgi:hypothetical protein